MPGPAAIPGPEVVSDPDLNEQSFGDWHGKKYADLPALLGEAYHRFWIAPVSMAPVKIVKSAPREEITGALQPAKALQAGFEVSGRLARILVKKGTVVGEGQVIA